MKFKSIIDLFFDMFRLVLVTITVTIFLYFVITNIVLDFFPNFQSMGKIINPLANKDITIILFVLFINYLILIFYEFKRGVIKKIYLNSKEKIVLLLSSYFLITFILKQFLLRQIFYYFLLILLGGLIFYLLVRVTSFMSQSYYSFRQIIKNVLSHPFLFIICCIIFLGIVGIILTSIHKYLLIQKEMRESFLITKINPKLTTVGEQITIEGYNFGFRPNDKFKLMSDYGQIPEILAWDLTRIEAIIPLYVEPGRVNFWIEKTITDSSSSAIIKSNKYSINITSRWTFYPEGNQNNQLLITLEKIFKKITRVLFLQ